MEPVNIHELRAKAASGAALSRVEELRLELMEKVNALGIGAQGLGGLTTVLDVKIMDYPTHAASLPVAMIPNCAATRHVHFHLDGSGPATCRAAEAGRLAAGHLEGRHQRRHPRRTSTPSPRKRSPPGSRARSCCSTARCSPAATPRTSASPTCWRRARSCRSTSPTASSTTSARSTRCATKSSARPAPPPPPAWTSSPA
jgi:hypothetical protein